VMALSYRAAASSPSTLDPCMSYSTTDIHMTEK